MSHAALDQELETELTAIAADCGCELAHVEFHRGTLKIILDRSEGSVTITDCQAVSKQVSSLLDIRDFGKDRYLLEVSSPGLDRELYGPKDYQRFLDHLVRVTFVEEGAKRTIVGRLQAFSADGDGLVTVTPSEGGTLRQDERLEIPLPAVQKARLEIEL